MHKALFKVIRIISLNLHNQHMGQVLDFHCIDKKTKVTERLCYLPKVIELANREPRFKPRTGSRIQAPNY